MHVCVCIMTWAAGGCCPAAKSMLAKGSGVGLLTCNLPCG